MKKIVILLFSMLIMGSAVSNAQNTILPKEWKKECKKQQKRLQKAGWQIFGSSRSLEYALLSHYEKQYEQGNRIGDGEVVGIATVSDARNKNLLRQQAINSAYTTYATRSVTNIKGKIVQELKLKDNEEVENFCAAYGASVEKEIKGELQPSFEVIKEVSPNRVDMQAFFVINKSSAVKARLQALENIIKNSNLAREHEEKLKNFITDEFEGN